MFCLICVFHHVRFTNWPTLITVHLLLSLHDMFKTGLSSMHTAWMREHNRLVRKLAELNPHWNDERLFHGMSKNI
jgi:hypothetical protein